MYTHEAWQAMTLLEKLETIGPGLFRAIVPFLIAIALGLLTEMLIRRYCRK